LRLRLAARDHVFRRRVACVRLADAMVAAAAADLGLPLVTADRRLARAVGAIPVQNYP
jgi:predicted nucleic acid-binding protein